MKSNGRTVLILLVLALSAMTSACATLGTRKGRTVTTDYDEHGRVIGRTVVEDRGQPSTLDMLTQGVVILNGVQDIRLTNEEIQNARAYRR